MNKEGYRYLFNSKEINRIPQAIIRKDVQSGLISKMGQFQLGDKEYVFFRDELVKDIERVLKDIER